MNSRKTTLEKLYITLYQHITPPTHTPADQSILIYSMRVRASSFSKTNITKSFFKKASPNYLSVALGARFVLNSTPGAGLISIFTNSPRE